MSSSPSIRDQPPVLPVLTAVAVIRREIPQLTPLTHVVTTINEYLDNSQQISIAKACALSSLSLVKHIVKRDACEPTESLKKLPMFRQWQFSTGLPNAIAAGDLELVQWLVQHFHECEVPARAVGQAATHDRLEILKWLRAQGCRLRAVDTDVEKALTADHEKIALWLTDFISEIGAVSNSRISWPYAAVAVGNQRMMLWGIIVNQTPTTRVFYGREIFTKLAATGGYGDIIEWLLNQVDEVSAVQLKYCAKGGHLMLMKWLHCHYKDYCIVEGALLSAARSGQLPVVQWLHETFTGSRDHGVSVFKCMDEAAGNGHLDVLKWLHLNRFEGCSPRAMDLAAKGGFLEVVEWLHENCFSGCSSNAIDGAAAGGHLAVVQWLHLNTFEGCTTAAMDDAAANGNLKMVEWLHEFRSEGCTVEAMNGAAMAGNLQIVKWLHTHRTEGCTVEAMDSAASGGHREMLQWLHSNRGEGCTVQAMNGAARSGHLEVVRWLHFNRSEGCTTQAIDDAAGFGHFDVVLFLHRERSEGCSVNALKKLFFSRHDEYFSWFEENYPVQFRASGVEPYGFNCTQRDLWVAQARALVPGRTVVE